MEIKGKFAEAIVFNDLVDENSIKQIIQIVNCKVAESSKIRIMPDVHAGAGCVIGFTSTITKRIVPNLIGVDIGCGVIAWKLEGLSAILFDELDKFIRKNIPAGFNVNNHFNKREVENVFRSFAHIQWKHFENRVNEICDKINIDKDRVWKSIGSLGGGNHFIEIDKDQNSNYWLVIHSGSRNFGLQIANYHQKKAKKNLEGKDGIIRGLEYLEGADAEEYYDDMKVAQIYARLSRMTMGKRIVENYFNIKDAEHIESVHNYIDFNDGVLRKGAISAHKGEPVIIPLNMADGCIIGIGKGNLDWNNSAPHGAGRTMSRTKAKQTIDINEYKDKMKNIWSSCVGEGTIDEAPQVYKNADDIIALVKDAVNIVDRMISVYNFKAN